MGVVRLLLALAVILSHECVHNIQLIPGSLAVQCFFAVSGFYMSLILCEKYTGAPIRLFYTNRFYRLYPTYLLMLAVSLAVLFWLDIGVFTTKARMAAAAGTSPVTAMALVFPNIFIIGQDLLFLTSIGPDGLAFAPGGANMGNGWMQLLVPQAWSLSMEFAFYLLAPFLVRKRLGLLILFAAASLALQVALIAIFPSDLVARKIMPAQLLFFLAGLFSYRVYARYGARLRPLGWQALGVFAAALLLAGRNGPWAGAALVIVLAAAMPAIFARFQDNSRDRFLGNLSYPVYMVHFLIIVVLEEYIEEPPLFLVLGAIALGALLLKYLLEDPIDRFRQRRLGRLRKSREAGTAPGLPVGGAPPPLPQAAVS